MKICLIRHGETDWNAAGKFQGREDVPLNEAGIRQMQNAAAYLKKSRWDEIVCSPLARAKSSAEIVRQETGVRELHEEADFMERDLGKISGLTWQETEQRFPDGNYEGIESLEMLQDRAIGALLKWTAKFDTKNIIILTHGGVINSILTALSGGAIETGKAIPRNAEITLLEKQGDDIQIIFHNKGWNEL